MINYKKFTLENGLTVIVHEDQNVETAVLNLIYDVGSKDENPNKTGFAHLFEHLMFGGSVNIDDFDGELQKVGADNNAFTSPDVTNYYITIPPQNLETAFWVESDRMLSLSFDPKVLEVQRSVVIEEFKQRYLNQPYGDVWLKLRPAIYQHHSYGWATIGKELSHIEEATMDDVKGFFKKHYAPDNAVLVVGGKVDFETVKHYAEKWFGPISPSNRPQRNLPVEPPQTAKRFLTVRGPVPNNALYMAFRMCERLNPDYAPSDLLSDVIGRGESSRLYRKLVEQDRIFNSLSAFVMGSMEPGLLIISGKPVENISLEKAEKEVWKALEDLQQNNITEDEVFKVKNQALSSIELGQIDLLERCINLGYNTILGNTELINTEKQEIQNVTKEAIQKVAQDILQESNCTVMYYKPEEA